MTSTHTESQENYLTTQEASERYNIPVGTLRYFRSINSGPASWKWGRRVLYRVSDIDRWLADREARTTRGGIL